MTSHNGKHIGAALGLYGTKDTWHLVMIERVRLGFRVSAQHAVERVGGDDDRGKIEALMSRLRPEDRGLPLGIAVADHVGMFRKIAAPRAEDAVLDKVVAAQVETMLPGGEDQVRWGWCRGRNGQDLWIHAMDRSDVDVALAALPDKAQVVSVISDTMALARLLTAGGNVPGGASLVLSIDETCSAFVLVVDGELKGVSMIEGGCDVSCAQGPEHNGWATRLSDAHDELLGAIPPDHRPVRCQLVCPTASRQRLSELGEGVLGMPMDAWSRYGDITDIDARDVAAVIAASAAASCFEPVTPAIRFADQTDAAVMDVRLRKYATIATAWLLIALMALYVSDRYRASGVNHLIDGGVLDQDRLSQLDQQIQVARYLETSGPIPLAIIDEIGQKTQGFMFDGLTYERGGTVRITGKQDSADAVGKLTEALAKVRTLWAVQLQNQTGAGEKTQFDITATASPKYFGAFVEPKPEKPEEPVEGKDQPE